MIAKHLVKPGKPVLSCMPQWKYWLIFLMFLLQDVAPSTVKLIVVDNIILQPSADMYILVGNKVHYKVKQLRRGHSKGTHLNFCSFCLSMSECSIPLFCSLQFVEVSKKQLVKSFKLFSHNSLIIICWHHWTLQIISGMQLSEASWY